MAAAARSRVSLGRKPAAAPEGTGARPWSTPAAINLTSPARRGHQLGSGPPLQASLGVARALAGGFKQVSKWS